MIFANRRHAGQLLAEKLKNYKNTKALVLALPRGGLPVAAEIAAKINGELDIIAVRKIGAPFQSEFALGALCEDQEPSWNAPLLQKLGFEPDDLGLIVNKERQKLEEQIRIFRDGRTLPQLNNKTVILVDDGLATGATVQAAVGYLKKKGVAKIVVAVPVAAADSAKKLRRIVSDVVVVEEREDLASVGEWYLDFTQVTNDEALRALHAEKAPRAVSFQISDVTLEGDLMVPQSMKALIIFAHGSGSSRKSPRNRAVASALNQDGFGTFLFDLLTDEESQNRRNVFDIELLASRLVDATKWVRTQPGLENVICGYFGASTGAGAAIKAAADIDAPKIYAIVSRGGRPDLAETALDKVQAPTLLLVGGHDTDVIQLNRQAQMRLSHSELKIVKGAGHLFEEPGTLEEVSRLAIQWFREQLPLIRLMGGRSQPVRDTIERVLTPLKKESDLDRLIEIIKDSRVVMLGESSHGTEEFYRLRAQISRRLIQHHGFKFIAVEGDWPDARRLNQYIKKTSGHSARDVLKNNRRWPTWMWANDATADLAEWMRSNKGAFYGLDLYSLYESMDEVVKYLKAKKLEIYKDVQRRYACFEPFRGDEISYAKSLISYPPGCETEVLSNLKALLKLRIERVLTDEGEELLSAQQNARVVAHAEAYYRAMLNADASSWNLRDSHMMDTLDLLLERSGENAKAIVWAHNTHIGDYRATDMKEAGYINLGGLARHTYGAENVALVGFGTYQGEVLAGSGWGEPEQVMTVPPAREGSYESHFHAVTEKTGIGQYYVLLSENQVAFSQRLPHRAIGVVYNPAHELRSNYVPTILSKRYNAFVFVDKSHALSSLHVPMARGEFPETWPSGV